MATYSFTFDDGSEQEFEWDESLGEPDEQTARRLAEQARQKKRLQSFSLNLSPEDADPSNRTIADRIKFDEANRSNRDLSQIPRVEIPGPERPPSPQEAEEEIRRRALEAISGGYEKANEITDRALGGLATGPLAPFIEDDQVAPRLSGLIKNVAPDSDNFFRGITEEIGGMAERPIDLAAIIAADRMIPGAHKFIGPAFRGMMGVGAAESGLAALEGEDPWKNAGKAVTQGLMAYPEAIPRMAKQVGPLVNRATQAFEGNAVIDPATGREHFGPGYLFSRKARSDARYGRSINPESIPFVQDRGLQLGDGRPPIIDITPKKPAPRVQDPLVNVQPETVTPEVKVPERPTAPQDPAGRLDPYGDMTGAEQVGLVLSGQKPAAIVDAAEASSLIPKIKASGMAYGISGNELYVAPTAQALDQLIRTTDPAERGRLLGYNDADIEAYNRHQALSSQDQARALYPEEYAAARQRELGLEPGPPPRPVIPPAPGLAPAGPPRLGKRPPQVLAEETGTPQVDLFDPNVDDYDKLTAIGAFNQGGFGPSMEGPMPPSRPELDESPEFLNWFGNSDVRHPVDGTPLIMFHGTGRNFTQFDRDALGLNRPLWFSTNPNHATQYAIWSGRSNVASNPNIMPTYLSIQNPLDLTKFNININGSLNTQRDIPLLKQLLPSYDFSRHPTYDLTAMFNDPAFVEAAKAAGFDGIKVYEDSDLTYAAFDPAQIKSATGNSGGYDPTNPDILAELDKNRVPASDNSGSFIDVSSPNTNYFRREIDPTQIPYAMDLLPVGEKVQEPVNYDFLRQNLPSPVTPDPRWPDGVAGNADWRVVTGGLGETLYGHDKGYSIAKETLQNSVDSVSRDGGSLIKFRTGKGRDPNGEEYTLLSMEDNGTGMLPADLSASPLNGPNAFGKFLKLGGTGKAGQASAAGKFGTAKAIILNNPEVWVDTVAVDPATGKKVHSILLLREGDMQQLYSNLATNLRPQVVEEVPDDVPTGTRIQIRMNGSHDYSAASYMRAAVGLGVPGIRFDIEGSYDGFPLSVATLPYLVTDVRRPAHHTKDVTLPSGNYKFEASPPEETTQSIIYYFNNGIWQGAFSYSWGGEVKAPKSVYVDVKSNVEPDDPNGLYPWESNRERLRGVSDAYQELITYMRELSTDLANQRRAAYQAVLTGGTEIPLSGGIRLLDPLNGADPQLLSDVVNAQYTGILAKGIKYHAAAVAKDFSRKFGNPRLENFELAGIGYHNRWSGLNVDGSLIGRAPYQIIINPWVIMRTVMEIMAVDQNVPVHGPWPKDYNQYWADLFGHALIKTIAHEVAHNVERSHDQVAFYNKFLDMYLARTGTKFGENLGRLVINYLEEIKNHAERYEIASASSTFNIPSHFGLDSKFSESTTGTSGYDIGSSEERGLEHGLALESSENSHPEKYGWIKNPGIRLDAEQQQRVIDSPTTSPERKARAQSKLERILKDAERFKDDTYEVDVIPPAAPAAPTVSVPKGNSPEVKLVEMLNQDWARQQSQEIENVHKKKLAQFDRELEEGLIDESTYAGLIEQLKAARDKDIEKLAKQIRKYSWSRPPGGGGGKKPPSWIPEPEGEGFGPKGLGTIGREVFAGAFFRALRSTGELSAPGRQGRYMAFSHPAIWFKAFVRMHKGAFSNKQYEKMEKDIENHPNFPLAKMAGLHIAKGPGTVADPKAREEFFESSWAEDKLGLFSKYVVRPASRGYVTFLNELRMGTFNRFVKLMTGKKTYSSVDEMYKKNHQALNAIANYINVATGRGDLGRAEEVADALSFVFFAPRWRTSRMQLLFPFMPIRQRANVKKVGWKYGTGELKYTLPKEWGKNSGWTKAETRERREEFLAELSAGKQPSRLFWKRTFERMPNRLRVEVAKDILANVAGYAGFLMIIGAYYTIKDMELDPSSTDFLKVVVTDKKGKDRHYDFLDSLRPLINVAAMIAFGKRKTAAGKEMNMVIPSRRRASVFDQVVRYGRSGLSPMGQFIVDNMDSKDFMNRPIILPRAALGQVKIPYRYPVGNEVRRSLTNMFAPMSWADMYEAYEGKGSFLGTGALPGGPGAALESFLPSFYGVGVQTYDPRDIEIELKRYEDMFEQVDPTPKVPYRRGTRRNRRIG